jgi:putative ABC transport system permease protein
VVQIHSPRPLFTNEFGIRMALGASGSDVFQMVLASTAINVGTGLVAGIILSIVFDKLSTRWVMESSRNPLILAGVTLILIAAAALACFVPARRAASVDPMEASATNNAAGVAQHK